VRELRMLLAVLAMSACAMDGGSTDEATNEPIAEVDLANGSRVMFYEPVPGAIAIGEQTAIGVAPVDTAGKSPLEIYRSIALGQPVPELLAAAQARADEARGERPAREQPAKPASVAGSSSFSASWFDNTYCQDPHYFNRTCHLGQDETGVKVDLDGTHYDIDEFSTTLCVNSGKVEFRAWVEDEKRMDVQIYGGDCGTYHWWSGLSNADSMRVATTILSESANYFLTVKWNH
jgi:hypothetical protein